MKTPKKTNKVQAGPESQNWPLEQLKGWDKNPRTVRDEDIARLKEQITKTGGLYKPLLILEDGTVIGGNMRLRALRELGYMEAWVNVIKPANEAEMIKIAMSDNGRAGYYVDEDLQQILKDVNWDSSMASLFKAETLPPISISDVLNQAAGGIIKASENKDEDTNDQKLENYENADTKQVVLYLTPGEKDTLLNSFTKLRVEMDLDTDADVLLAMVRNKLATYEDSAA